MNAFIKEYVETITPPDELLKKHVASDPDNKLYKELYKISQLLKAPRQPDASFQCEDAFLFEKEYDKDLVGLYYQFCARLALYYENLKLASLCYRRSDSYFDKTTPPYVAFPTSAALIFGQPLYAFIEDHLAKYVETSPRYAIAFETYFQKLACVGALSQEKLVGFYFNNNLFKPNQSRIDLAKFVNYVETFQHEKIKEFYPIIFAQDFSIGTLSGQYQEILPHYKLLYQVLFETNQSPISHYSTNKNILIMYYLINRQYQKALQIAKEFFVDDLSRMLTYNLVRCELVNKNFESAYRILKSFVEEGQDDYLLPFFMARVEIYKGNKEIASKYFNQSLSLSRKYQAEELFNFEIGLSYELSIADLRYLFGNTEKNDFSPADKELTTIVPSKQDKEILVGSSKKIIELKNQISNYANSDIPVLIIGETGVGKDLVAKMIHDQSGRKENQFAAVNCGALSESLLQSELFGHEAGSFTGASKAHKGLFEAVGKGTIFLDEIGEISAPLQVALLRVLDQNEYKPVGSNTSKKCHCRILFATNADLERLVEENKFRKDLLFRLKRLEILIPPLRTRAEDIPELIRYYISIGRSDQKVPVLTPDLIDAFQNYSWPGNIRQLKNEMEKLRVLHSEKLNYTLRDFPFKAEIQTMPKKKSESNEQAKPIRKENQELVEAVLSNSKSAIRRLDKLKELFITHKKFTRKELIAITSGAPKTVANDLEFLCEEGFIVRVKPSSAARTHYFELKY